MAPEIASHTSLKSNRRLMWSGYLLGFALGGFFDGILLHQILQWHHLLSSVEGAVFQDIRVQILADGLFHVLMYVIAIVGLWLLWGVRKESEGGKALLGCAIAGFGAWHVLDSILFHWILGIHRTRMGAENVLLWDLMWFLLFGIVPLVAAWLLRRKSGGGGSSSGEGRRSTSAWLLALTVLAAGPIAALPPTDATAVMVFFKPGTGGAEIFHAIDAVDGRVLWAAAGGEAWALHLDDLSLAPLLYQHGAYLVSSSMLIAGCLAWVRA